MCLVHVLALSATEDESIGLDLEGFLGTQLRIPQNALNNLGLEIMERDASKKAESSCEVTDSGFNEESKDDEIDHWRQAKSSLYVRSPSYDKPAPSKKCSDGAQICLKTPDGDGNT